MADAHVISLIDYAGLSSTVLDEKRMHSSKRVTSVAHGQGAGLSAQRLAEVNGNTRKNCGYNRNKSSNVKGALLGDHVPQTGNSFAQTETTRSARSDMKRYAFTNEEFVEGFETKWQWSPTLNRMSMVTGRKPGYSNLESDVRHMDIINTYRREKGEGGSNLYSAGRSCLQNEGFVTVREDANRSDRPPNVVNRSPPFPNKDGPFESAPPASMPRPKRSNLNRICVPREDVEVARPARPPSSLPWAGQTTSQLEPSEGSLTLSPARLTRRDLTSASGHQKALIDAPWTRETVDSNIMPCVGNGPPRLA